MTTDYSLNEIENLAKKAARGVGYNWGIAEEAGYAVRQLHAIGINGSSAFVQLADIISKTQLNEHRPHILSNSLNSGQFGCPITIGCFLLDELDNITFDGLNIKTVIVPILLLPFIANISSINDKAISISWNEICFNVIGDKIERVAYDKHSSHHESANVQLRYANTPGTLMSKRTRAKLKAETIYALEVMASATYAPATEESRIKGAGA